MSARKLLLLVMILGCGVGIEAAWRLRNLGVTNTGCWFLPNRLRGPSFTYPSEREIPITDEKTVEIWNSFGRVLVKAGSAGKVRVHLTSVVYLPTEALARNLASEVSVESHSLGSVLKVETNRQDLERLGRLANAGLETHLELEVPPKTSIRLHNDHGAVDVSDVAGADLHNAFGNLKLSRVGGPASLVSRHGDVVVAEVTGELNVDSHFGDVRVDDGQGRAFLKVSHGDLALNRVAQVRVELHSGDLKAATVHGELDFVGEHAGIEVSDVDKACTIRTSYRGVEVSNVAGDLKVKTQHGSLLGKGIAGNVDAEVTFDDAKLTAVKGLVVIKIIHGGFRGEALGEGARVNASGDDVVLAGFKGPVVIEVSRGSVELKPTGPLIDPITVTTTSGGISLAVPVGSRFDLDASASSGDLALNHLPNLVETLSSASHVTGHLGGGGNNVRLVATRGSVKVEGEGEGGS